MLCTICTIKSKYRRIHIQRSLKSILLCFHCLPKCLEPTHYGSGLVLCEEHLPCCPCIFSKEWEYIYSLRYLTTPRLVYFLRLYVIKWWFKCFVQLFVYSINLAEYRHISVVKVSACEMKIMSLNPPRAFVHLLYFLSIMESIII